MLAPVRTNPARSSAGDLRKEGRSRFCQPLVFFNRSRAFDEWDADHREPVLSSLNFACDRSGGRDMTLLLDHRTLETEADVQQARSCIRAGDQRTELRIGQTV